jgi:hypothetical protein
LSDLVLNLALLIALVLAAGGCGQADSGDEPFATRAGASVGIDTLTNATLMSRGGGLTIPGRPQGAACDPQVYWYTLDLAAGTLQWSRCQVAGDGQTAADYSLDERTRTLSSSERHDAQAALHAVRVSDGTGCGADKAYLELTVHSPTGWLTYGDDFYACTNKDKFVYFVNGLDNLHTALSPMAH